jgi:hypothetical protein
MEPLVSAEQVRARWAYSELLSDRPYDDPSVQELKKKALERVPFEDLNAEEHGVLAQAWYRVRGVPTFIHGFAGITSFQLADWSREQLAASYVIPYFAHEVGAQEPKSSGSRLSRLDHLNQGTLAMQHPALLALRKVSHL